MQGVASSDAAALAAVMERPEPAGAAKTTGPARFTPAYSRAFTPLAGARLHLVTGEITVQPNSSQPSRQFLAPDFVEPCSATCTPISFSDPIFKVAAATIGGMVDRKGQPVAPPTARPAGGAFLIRCDMLYRRGQGEAERLCNPNGGHLLHRILKECHDTPLGGHFGRHKTAALVRLPAFWPGQTRDVAEYVRTCDTCQRV
jgi:hypothetical protein